MPSYKFYDNLSVVSLGSLVVCGVGGAALWLGVAAGGLPPPPQEGEDQLDSGLTWLSLATGGTGVSLLLLIISCSAKNSFRHETRHSAV